VATALIWLTGADMKAARSNYETFQGWAAVENLPWSILYTYAPLPGLVLAGGALFVFVAGFFKRIFRPYGKQSVFLVLMLALGPGLLVNVILKTIWAGLGQQILSSSVAVTSTVNPGNMVSARNRNLFPPATPQ